MYERKVGLSLSMIAVVNTMLSDHFVVEAFKTNTKVSEITDPAIFASNLQSHVDAQ